MGRETARLALQSHWLFAVAAFDQQIALRTFAAQIAFVLFTTVNALVNLALAFVAFTAAAAAVALATFTNVF